VTGFPSTGPTGCSGRTLKLLKGFTSLMDKIGTCIGELQAATTPLKQRCAKALFELVKPPNHRSVSHPEFSCGFSETAAVGNDQCPTN
jgi:hypothetical protein